MISNLNNGNESNSISDNISVVDSLIASSSETNGNYSYSENIRQYAGKSWQTKEEDASNEYSSPASIYEREPKRYKLGSSQFEVLFPFITQFDKYLTTFTSFDKREVIVEFGVYLDFILDNLDKDLSNIMWLEEDLEEHAREFNHIMNYFRMLLDNLAKEGKLPLTAENVRKNVPDMVQQRFKRTLTARPYLLTKLWQSFILNIAILNVKSVILCGEYAKRKLGNNQREVLPLKFVPVLGSEISLLSPREKLTLNEVKDRIVTDTLGDEDVKKILVSTLRKSEVENIQDYTLNGTPIYVPALAEAFGYTQDRYAEAERTILFYASSTEETLEQCNEYLDGHMDYIGSLGALYAELKFMNEREYCIVLDFEY